MKLLPRHKATAIQYSRSGFSQIRLQGLNEAANARRSRQLEKVGVEAQVRRFSVPILSRKGQRAG
jgi:hypothetical protein